MFSSTTIASSTTMPVERTMASKVRMLMLKPDTYMMKNDPISEIGIAITGIKVVRQFRRKMKMMRTTSPKAMRMVSSTSRMALRMPIVVSSATL